MNELGRFDFVIIPESWDDETRQVCLRLEPNPERYDLVRIEGREYFLDRISNTLFLAEEIYTQMLNFGGKGIHFLEPTVTEQHAYSLKRRAALTRQLQSGHYEQPEEKAKKHLSPTDNSVARNFVFLSMDVCGSTVLRKAGAPSFDKSLNILFQELATLVGQYHGFVHKFTGDGFIAVVDYPAFTSQCDAGAYLGLAMLYQLANAINPALIDEALPPLSIRIGIEFGEATVRRIHIPATEAVQVDFVSDALNQCVKIQESCSPNQVRIGQGIHGLMHTSLALRAKVVEFDGGCVGDGNYKVYQLE